MTGSSQVQDGPGEVGRCGDRAPQVLIDGGIRAFCRLPAGHAGWHRGDDNSEWSPEFASAGPDYTTAYASLHEVVRAFLAGERNAKYLRRMHAEIETELAAQQPKSTPGMDHPDEHDELCEETGCWSEIDGGEEVRRA